MVALEYIYLGGILSAGIVVGATELKNQYVNECKQLSNTIHTTLQEHSPPVKIKDLKKNYQDKDLDTSIEYKSVFSCP